MIGSHKKAPKEVFSRKDAKALRKRKEAKKPEALRLCVFAGEDFFCAFLWLTFR
jgi:hypothetical protein